MIRSPSVAAQRAAAAFGLAILAGGCAPESAGPVASAQGPGLTGVLVDEVGAAVAFRSVMACTPAVCFYAGTGADGRFRFLLDEPIRGVIKTDEDLRSTPRRGSPMVPVVVAANEMLDVGEVVVPSLAAGAPLDRNATATQTVDVGDGLSLRLQAAAIETAPGRPLSNVAARRLPVHAIPDYEALAGGPVVAVYALHPFGAKSAVPMEVRIETDLPDGARVGLRIIDEIDGTFSDPVPAVVRDGVIATVPGAGIGSLTHLVVVGAAAD